MARTALGWWWLGCPLCLLLLFQGWYIVTYALGIYHLNLFIAFLSPKVDPSLMEDSGTAIQPSCHADTEACGVLRPVQGHRTGDRTNGAEICA